MSEVVMPKPEKLEEIRKSGRSANLLWKEVGPYQLSVIYRQSSAVGGPEWYPEGMIFIGEGKHRKFVYQDEGWGVFRLFALHLETTEEVEAFLKQDREDRDA